MFVVVVCVFIGVAMVGVGGDVGVGVGGDRLLIIRVGVVVVGGGVWCRCCC